VSDAIEKE